ncbi:hypothetical protein [Nocardioides sp. zg-DK7169]|uniref:hypothetical protein n=1 Tax=Nocardioides sp. zg-DK7169 TaxID=2736600 RepID=UPI001557DFD0|nr:hypothetical protein [Nocardioides sp. zg-DK7169]NPC96595.1 hypothetical protein [Nocardioides sp. zg-DK7169]
MTPRPLLGLVCVATLLLTATTACGDDDSSEVCATLDSLDASIIDVTDGDLDQDTLTKLEAEAGDVRTDVEQIRAEAADEHSAEIDAVEQAAADLSTSLDAARATPNPSTLADVASANEALDDAVDDLDDALDDTC